MLNTIFSIDNGKAVKAQKYGWIDAIHYMAPHDLAGVGNLCPHSTPGCRALCLGEYSGQAGMARDGEVNVVRRSRRDKAIRFMTDRSAYMQDVVLSIAKAITKAAKLDLQIVIRLNGSTDIAWEGIRLIVNPDTAKRASIAPGPYANLMSAFPHVQFMDYTKSAKRLARKLPANYDLTLSRSEMNEQEAIDLARTGNVRVAVVFAEMPETWHGMPVVSGDEHDLRFLDPTACIVGLLPKGHKAKRDQSGFVVREVTA